MVFFWCGGVTTSRFWINVAPDIWLIVKACIIYMSFWLVWFCLCTVHWAACDRCSSHEVPAGGFMLCLWVCRCVCESLACESLACESLACESLSVSVCLWVSACESLPVSICLFQSLSVSLSVSLVVILCLWESEVHITGLSLWLFSTSLSL